TTWQAIAPCLNTAVRHTALLLSSFTNRRSCKKACDWRMSRSRELNIKSLPFSTQAIATRLWDTCYSRHCLDLRLGYPTIICALKSYKNMIFWRARRGSVKGLTPQFG